MKKIFTFLFLCITLTMSAVPARPGQYKLIQLADGTFIRAELKGDESVHYYLGDDNKAYVFNEAKQKYETVDLQLLLESAQARSYARNMQRVGSRAINGTIRNISGQKKGLVILANFTDTKFQTGHDLALYQKILNQEGCSENGFKGSVKDYFKAQSNGTFILDFDVVGPVELPHNTSYYGDNRNNKPGQDVNSSQMIIDACNLAKDKVNFKNYDWDNDGAVEQVFVVFAGLGEADGGLSSTVWPQQWTLSAAGKSPITLDNVKINTYAYAAELQTKRNNMNVTVGNQISGIGTFCHEFSHCLGFPDMYDTRDNATNYGMYRWDLMDLGNYNGNGYLPSGYTSYEKMIVGWLKPIELKDQNTTVTGMKALSENGNAYIIYNQGNKNEYLLLENRQRTKCDAGLPGKGLLVIHVDYDPTIWSSNKVNSTSIEHLTVIPASGNKTTANVANDPYPYLQNDSITNTSLPTVVFHNKNTDGTTNLNHRILNIKDENGLISFNYKSDVPGSTTGIEKIISGSSVIKQDNKIYTQEGIYVGTDLPLLPKGVYIQNGKKIIKR